MRFYALGTRPWVEDAEGGRWGLPAGAIGAVSLAPVGSQQYVFITGETAFAPRDVAARIGDGTRLDSYVPSSNERSDWSTLIGVAYQSGWTLLDLLWATLTTESDPDGVTGPKPIMPTHRGVLELHLGGHSLVRAERLPDDPTMHPAWAKMQRVVHNDYRRLAAQDTTLARKWLGAQAAKYRLSPEAARDLLVPTELPRVLPLKPTTTVSDDFNRADGAIGANWTDQKGTWEVESNQAHQSSNSARGGTTYNTGLSSDDHYAETDRVSGSGVAALARCGSGTEAHYRGIHLFQSGPGQTLQIQHISSGWSITTQLYYDTTGSTPGRVGIECDGSTITVYSDNRPRQSITDTQVSGQLRAGIGTNSAASVIHDNFEAADLVAETELVRVRSEAAGVAEAMLRACGRTRARAEAMGIALAVTGSRAVARRRDEAVAAAEAGMVARTLARMRAKAIGVSETGKVALTLLRLRAHAIGISETGKVARTLLRLRAQAIGLTETTVSIVQALGEAVVRAVTEAVAMAETVARSRRLARIRSGLVGIAGAVAKVGGVIVATAAAIISGRIRMHVRPSSRLSVKPSARTNVPPARR